MWDHVKSTILPQLTQVHIYNVDPESDSDLRLLRSPLRIFPHKIFAQVLSSVSRGTIISPKRNIKTVLS